MIALLQCGQLSNVVKIKKAKTKKSSETNWPFEKRKNLDIL